MLHSFGIRTKLLALLALPIVALIAISGFTSVQAFGQASQARQIEQLASGSGALARLVSALQVERSLSIASIQKSPVASELKRARANTDDSLKATDGIRSALEGASLNPKAQAALLRSVLGHDQLADLRETVSGGFAKEELVADQYAAIIANDITLPQRVADSLDSPAIRAQLTAYALSQELVELATQERDAGVAVIAERRASPQTAATLARVAALRLQTETDLRVNSTDEQIAVLDEVLSSPVLERAAYRDMQQALVAAGTTGAVDLDVSQWRNAANARLDALGTLAQPTAASAAEIAADEASSQRSRAFLVLALTALVVLVLVLAGLVLSRAITRPLRHLTDVAGRVRDELPLMVERMSAPGDGPGVELPEIPVGSQDEVGQLARAFKDVNDTTIRVAEEQAALRASIAEMFVNVARRNHILLSRQLSFIDQLERTEENPDTLDSLFRLDHLATRMRRNAESLIVLAGIDAGRRLRRPMPLSDVIRTAVSEIERYDRVDLALQADPPVVGHVALTTAHLLAELLENATQFSNPDTRVVTSTAFAGDGVRITITDLGLGMTGAEIDDANTRIANPPMRDVVGSSRLGFYVVGRLARRLDATVELKAGRAQGTVVTVDLPPSLFTAGSVVDFSGISDTGAITPALPAAPDAEVSAPAPGLPAAPATGGGLPRRGQHQAEPVPSVEPVTAQDAPEPAQESPSRSRVFSGFRSRREPGDAVGSSVVPPSLPASGLPVVADSPTTFVPAVVADELLPQLPQRGQATAPALAAPALAAPAPVPAPVPAPADHAPQWALALDAPVAAPV
ncbi:MAG TPA: nitrate- and nitrite sensing domain-containing protein, partial [Actinomycetales bacterium]